MAMETRAMETAMATETETKAKATALAMETVIKAKATAMAMATVMAMEVDNRGDSERWRRGGSTRIRLRACGKDWRRR
jgi:hypothetical protein